MTASPKTCPRCRKISPAESSVCDCGGDLETLPIPKVLNSKVSVSIRLVEILYGMASFLAGPVCLMISSDFFPGSIIPIGLSVLPAVITFFIVRQMRLRKELPLRNGWRAGWGLCLLLAGIGGVFTVLWGLAHAVGGH